MKTIIRFNASAAKESSCLRRTWHTVIDGYAEKQNTNDVVFGSGIHEYIKKMRLSRGNYGIATLASLAEFNKPKKTKDNKDYLNDTTYFTNTCQRFWDEYLMIDSFQTLEGIIDCWQPHCDKGIIRGGTLPTTCAYCKGTGRVVGPLVELKFEIPYYADEQVDVFLCGTIDDLCKHKNGCYAVRDYKTTSVWKINDYLSSYAMSPQLMFYRMAVEYYAKTYPDSIFATMITKGTIGCFVEGIFLKGKDKDVEFKRSEVFQFPEWKMNEFRGMLDKTIHRLKEYVKANTIPPREGMLNGACATVYGPCRFFNVCNAATPEKAQQVLEYNFNQTTYDPINRE